MQTSLHPSSQPQMHGVLNAYGACGALHVFATLSSPPLANQNSTINPCSTLFPPHATKLPSHSSQSKYMCSSSSSFSPHPSFPPPSSFPLFSYEAKAILLPLKVPFSPRMLLAYPPPPYTLVQDQAGTQAACTSSLSSSSLPQHKCRVPAKSNACASSSFLKVRDQGH